MPLPPATTTRIPYSKSGRRVLIFLLVGGVLSTLYMIGTTPGELDDMSCPELNAQMLNMTAVDVTEDYDLEDYDLERVSPDQRRPSRQGLCLRLAVGGVPR